MKPTITCKVCIVAVGLRQRAVRVRNALTRLLVACSQCSCVLQVHLDRLATMCEPCTLSLLVLTLACACGGRSKHNGRDISEEISTLQQQLKCIDMRYTSSHKLRSLLDDLNREGEYCQQTGTKLKNSTRAWQLVDQIGRSLGSSDVVWRRNASASGQQTYMAYR